MSNIIDYRVTEYLEGFYKPLSPLLAEIRKKGEAEGIPILLKETEIYLRNLLHIVKPERILEVGTAIGYSALFFKKSLPEANIITIEKREDMKRIAEDNFKLAGASIRLVCGDAPMVLKEMSGKDAPFDFVFIDGGHGHYMDIWNATIPLCHKGTVVVSDNVLYKGMTASDEFIDTRRNRTIMNRMRHFLDSITDMEGVSTAVLPIGDGIAVSIVL